MMYKIKCKICEKPFKAKRKHAKYCSPDCRKKGMIKNTQVWRKGPNISNTARDLMTKEPYKSNYEKIIDGITEFENKKKKILEIQLSQAEKHGKKQAPLIKEKLMKNCKREKYPHKKIRQKITWDYFLKKTKMSPETLSRYINNMRKVGILEENGYKICGNYRFEPLRIWQTNTLKNWPSYNIYSHENSTLLLKNKKQLQDNEKRELNILIDKHIKTYQGITNHLKIIGSRIAGDVWSEIIKNRKISNELKFYFWLKLILIHYLATISFDELSGCFRLRENPHVDMDTIKRIKYAKFAPPFDLLDYLNINILSSWQVELFNLFDKAFWKYLDKLCISIDKNKFKKQVDLNKTIFHTLIEKTLIKRAEAELFICFIHPEHLSYFSLMEMGREDKMGAFDVHDASSIGYEPEKIEPIKKQHVNKSFFDDSSFFDGFDAEVEKLFENVQDLKNQLRELAQTFECPKIKKPS